MRQNDIGSRLNKQMLGDQNDRLCFRVGTSQPFVLRWEVQRPGANENQVNNRPEMLASTRAGVFSLFDEAATATSRSRG